MERAQRIIRKHKLADYTGLQRTAIEEAIARNEFPKPVPLTDGGRAIGFLESEVIEWQKRRIAAREAQEQQRASKTTKKK